MHKSEKYTDGNFINNVLSFSHVHEKVFLFYFTQFKIISEHLLVGYLPFLTNLRTFGLSPIISLGNSISNQL